MKTHFKHISFIFLFSAIFIVGPCSIIKISIPTKGVIIDKVSKKPIANARLKQTVSIGYFDPGGGHQSDLQIEQCVSNKTGEFHFDSAAHFVFPINVGLKYEITAIVPGYWPLVNVQYGRFDYHKLVQLRKIQYYLPLFYFSKGILDTDDGSEDSMQKAIIQSKIFKKIDLCDFEPLSEPGVFASAENAEFSKISVDDETIKAFDNNSGRTLKWDHFGNFIEECITEKPIFEPKVEKITKFKKELVDIINTAEHISEEEIIFIQSLIDKEVEKFQYASKNKGVYFFIIRENEGNWRYQFTFKAGFVIRTFKKKLESELKKIPNVSWVDVPQGKISSYTHVNGNLYLAFENEGVFRLGGAKLRDNLMENKNLFSGPITFINLGGWRMCNKYCWDSTFVIYAVADDNKIYRFGLDGTLDKKIDIK